MARRTKFGTISVYTDVEVDISDVLEELTNDDLIEEFQRRKLDPKKISADPPLEEDLECVLEQLRRGLLEDAIVLLDRLIHPKFKSLKLCIASLPQPQAVVGGSLGCDK